MRAGVDVWDGSTDIEAIAGCAIQRDSSFATVSATPAS
jgi:hypothetical protein